MLIAILVYLLLTLYSAIAWRSSAELRNMNFVKMSKVMMFVGSLLFGIAEITITTKAVEYAATQEQLYVYFSVILLTIINALITIWAMKQQKKCIDKAIVCVISVAAILFACLWKLI